MSHIININRKFFLLLTASFFLVTKMTQAANFIFDLEGVLAKQSVFSVLSKTASSLLTNWYNPFAVKEKILQTVMTEECKRTWLCGLKRPQQILEEITNHIKGHPELFSTPGEAAVIQAISRVIFTPEEFAQTFYPIREGISLVKKIHAQKNAQGNPVHKITILSELDAETAEILQKNWGFKKLFSIVNGSVFSGNVHMMKSDFSIIDYLCKNHNIDLNNELTFFIDNSMENIVEARKNKKARNLNKFYALHCDGNYHRIEKILKQFKIFA